MHFILVRHCLTDWNEQGRWQGRTDIPLNDTGRAQARDFATILENKSIAHIVSSPLQRAYETAKIIGAHLSIPITCEEALTECSFGKLEGLTKKQIVEVLGHAVPDDQDPYDFRSHAGEHYTSVRDRHLLALEKISSISSGPVLIVGHGRGLNTLLAHFGTGKIHRERNPIVELHI